MLQNIAEFLAKHKGFLEGLLLPTILLLVGLSAFGLGRLSALEATGPRLLVRLPDGTMQALQASASQTAAVAAGNATPASNVTGGVQGSYVASKSGTRYYLPACSGASRIKEENKVWFATVGEAQAAGYTAAANCPGL